MINLISQKKHLFTLEFSAFLSEFSFFIATTREKKCVQHGCKDLCWTSESWTDNERFFCVALFFRWAILMRAKRRKMRENCAKNRSQRFERNTHFSDYLRKIQWNWTWKCEKYFKNYF
jgi:hypothetical protein